MKYTQKQPHVCLNIKKTCSELAAQILTVAAQNIHTLREDFKMVCDGY